MTTALRHDSLGHTPWWRAVIIAGAIVAPATGMAQHAVTDAPAPAGYSTKVDVSNAVPEHAMDPTDRAGEVIRGRYDGSEGARPWRLFVPSKRSTAPAMLLVVLHGCTQNADDIAAGTRMDEVAEEKGFYVLYPEQIAAANPRVCWNWFDGAHQSRGSGEPAIIASMLADVLKRPELANTVDRAQVHLVGVSAGAAMANLVAVAYPETFASLSSMSGIGWKAASDVARALTVMQQGSGDGLPSAAAIVQAMGVNARALPTLVVHGARDAVVNVRNGEETAQQWVDVHNLLRVRRSLATLTSDAVPRTRVENGYSVSERDWRDDRGVTQVTFVRIEALGHAWSGGSPAGTFTDAKGPDVTRVVAAFCLSHPMRGTP